MEHQCTTNECKSRFSARLTELAAQVAQQLENPTETTAEKTAARQGNWKRWLSVLVRQCAVMRHRGVQDLYRRVEFSFDLVRCEMRASGRDEQSGGRCTIGGN